MNVRQQLEQAMSQRILVLDGAMGTTIQGYGLTEADYRGERLADWPSDLKGNNDLLNLTRPDVIREIHQRFADAGSDLLETNTFSANALSQADYGLEALSYEINVEGARLAREVADAETARDPSRPRFVAGALGPTTRTASISPDVNDPSARNVTFEELRAAYYDNARGLLDGGAHLLLVETIFDTLNAKAALFAIDELLEHRGEAVPVMISGTITDASGRTLSGQTTAAFWHSVRHARPLTIGLNCALGAPQMRPFVDELSRIADTWVCAYPNAGLPNEMGEYDISPHDHGEELRAWAQDGLVNIVGGCCGTRPDHIARISEVVAGVKPRVVPQVATKMRLSGLEPLTL